MTEITGAHLVVVGGEYESYIYHPPQELTGDCTLFDHLVTDFLAAPEGLYILIEINGRWHHQEVVSEADSGDLTCIRSIVDIHLPE